VPHGEPGYVDGEFRHPPVNRLQLERLLTGQGFQRISGQRDPEVGLQLPEQHRVDHRVRPQGELEFLARTPDGLQGQLMQQQRRGG
jgi:hypothetical protein